LATDSAPDPKSNLVPARHYSDVQASRKLYTLNPNPNVLNEGGSPQPSCYFLRLGLRFYLPQTTIAFSDVAVHSYSRDSPFVLYQISSATFLPRPRRSNSFPDTAPAASLLQLRGSASTPLQCPIPKICVSPVDIHVDDS
jgi:hypothetical protein